MGKVIVGFTMSLDGFIAGPNDDVSKLFKWYFSGDVPFPVPGTNMTFKVAQGSVEAIQPLFDGTFGAIVTGRHDFDVSNAWGGTSPLNAPVFIVTHNPPQEWLNKPSPFTFVTDGVASAVEQARQVAGTKPVAIGGTTITRQLLQAGLIDEIHIELAAMLLGSGTRLFEHLGQTVDLEIIKVIPSQDVTHLKYRVVK